MEKISESIIVREWDDTGHECAAYTIKSSTGQISTRSEAQRSYAFDVTRFLKNAFLPAGYPLSVSPDYLRYQVYNVLQNFCSSLAGLIASRAVLEGHGVGNASASATDALLLTILQDVFSRVTTILSAYYLGTRLFPEAKTYRFLADIFNDGALVVDTLSPYFVSNAAGGAVSYRGLALCISGGLRALCGVVAGGSKAALTMHFAQPPDASVAGDIGDLSAKDGSKETVLALLGMLCGSVLVPHLHNAYATYSALAILIIAHLALNYLGVRAVILRSLNRQRTSILWASYRQAVLDQSAAGIRAPTPAQVSAQEHIFASPSVLLHPAPNHLRRVSGYCTMGVSVSTVLGTHQPHEQPKTWSFRPTVVPSLDASSLAELLSIHSSDKYLLWSGSSSQTTRPHVIVVLKEGHKSVEHIRAWVHAAEVAHRLTSESQGSPQEVLKVIRATHAIVQEHFPSFMECIKKEGWTLDGAGGGLLTGPSRAIKVEERDRKTK